MDEEERALYEKERSLLKEHFRNEEVKYFPILIKASSKG